MEKVNKYLKNIGLGNIFRGFIWEKKKKNNWFFWLLFYIFHKSGIKTFLNSPLTNALRQLLIVVLYVRVSTDQKKPLTIGLDLIILN